MDVKCSNKWLDGRLTRSSLVLSTVRIVEVGYLKNVMKQPGRFVLTSFQKFCIRWSVLFDSSSDRLSRTERALRSVQFSMIMITSVMTMTSVLIADNKKALESFTYFVICVFMLAIITFAIRTKRFNRTMLLMIIDEFPGYERPMPEALKRKMSAIRTSYGKFTMKIMISYLTLVLFEIPATAMVPLTAASLTDVKLGSQSTQMVVLWFPGDTTQIRTYVFSFVAQILIVMIVKFIITGIMCSFSFFVNQMITEFQILSAYIKHAIEIVEYDISTDKTTEQKLLDHVKSCVMLHHRLIDFKDQLNESYGYIILLELMFSTLYFCLSAFNMIFVGNKFVIAKGLLTLSNYLAELFIFCMFGSMVEDAHVGLLRASYSAEWYTQSVRFRRSLMMIMSRTQTSLQLTIGKVFIANLPLFLSVLKVSYSGVNALRAANAK
ncbi:odorant receptor 4-like [Melanaphis sacchari]|uniref:odorant receptor 4-like n=1 Tax=Melanaphis sacchari TaxID=742174 RepID=UPI000DC1463E|nr:odorant receptor 4-like [Melanaphis sacchari]